MKILKPIILLTTIILISIILASMMIIHAIHQPLFNEANRIEAEIEAYRNGAIVGWVRMDDCTKQLYFVRE